MAAFGVRRVCDVRTGRESISAQQQQLYFQSLIGLPQGTARINVTEGKHNFHVTKTRVVTEQNSMKRIPGTTTAARTLLNTQAEQKQCE